jgi:hypothetical protein
VSQTRRVASSVHHLIIHKTPHERAAACCHPRGRTLPFQPPTTHPNITQQRRVINTARFFIRTSSERLTEPKREGGRVLPPLSSPSSLPTVRLAKEKSKRFSGFDFNHRKLHLPHPYLLRTLHRNLICRFTPNFRTNATYLLTPHAGFTFYPPVLPCSRTARARTSVWTRSFSQLTALLAKPKAIHRHQHPTLVVLDHQIDLPPKSPRYPQRPTMACSYGGCPLRRRHITLACRMMRRQIRHHRHRQVSELCTRSQGEVRRPAESVGQAGGALQCTRCRDSIATGVAPVCA